MRDIHHSFVLHPGDIIMLSLFCWMTREQMSTWRYIFDYFPRYNVTFVSFWNEFLYFRMDWETVHFMWLWNVDTRMSFWLCSNLQDSVNKKPRIKQRKLRRWLPELPRNLIIFSICYLNVPTENLFLKWGRNNRSSILWNRIFNYIGKDSYKVLKNHMQLINIFTVSTRFVSIAASYWLQHRIVY